MSSTDLVYKLKMTDALLADVAMGARSSTVRQGRRNVVRGHMLLEPASGTGRSALVYVTRVTFCLLSQLTDADARHQGCTVGELQNSLRGYYPALVDDGEVTIIEFDFNRWRGE